MVNISWQASTARANATIRQYSIYRGGILLNTVSASSTSYSDTTVLGGTTYSYTVSATDNNGTPSGQSPPATVTTLSCGPTVPGNVSARAVSCSQINLSWSASTDPSATVTRYNVYRNGVALAAVSAPNTSFSDTTVVASTTYNYTISATDSAGVTSGQSTPAGATTSACVDTTPPTVPANVVATAINCTNVSVSWSASTDTGSGVHQYNVYRNANLISIVAAPATTFIDTSVSAATGYAYTVSATDVAGNTSALSGHSSVVTPNCGDTTPPTVPTGVTASAASCSQVNVSWAGSSDSGSGVKQYNVYRNGGLLTTVSATTTSFPDTTVAASSLYNYTVSATDNAGNTSAQSTAAGVTTPACGDTTPPTVPTGVSATAPSCSQVNVSWTGSTDSGSGVRQYNIYRNGGLLTTVAAGTTSFSDNSVAASTAYSYAVSATDNSGNTSAQSTAAGVTTPACAVDTTPPTVPANVVATALNCTNVNLSWAASTDTGSGVRQYNIYRDGALINIVAAPATSALDTSVSPSTTHSYTISATDAAGNTSALSTPAPVTTPVCGGSCTVTVNVSASTGGTASGGGTVNCGSSVTVNATPNSCNQFVNWTVNGTAVSTSASYTFAPGASETIVANFAPTSYTVSTSASPAGSGTVSGGGTANCGSSVTVSASAASGYVFTNWTQNGVVIGTSASYTFTASANMNLVANFAVAPCTDTIGTAASPAAGGSVTGGGSVSCGSSVTVRATANSCYSFVNWTLNGTVVSTSASYSFTANANQTLTANFTPITYTVSTSASTGGTASGGGNVSCGSSVAVSATSSSCYRFVSWTLNGTVVSTSASYTFAPSATETVTANFTPITYTISTSPSTGGTASGGGTVNCGSSVTVTATANSCYSFVNWTANGAVVSTSASYNFVPSASETLTANFAQSTYTITTGSSPSAGGTTSGGGTVSCGNSVSVNASPASGYTFSSWTLNGSVVSASSTYTFAPSANESLMANFTAAACTYSLSSSNASYSSSGGTGSVTVTAGSSCSWTAASGASWITITAGASGTGNGTVNYSVAANTSSSTLTGTITIAGQTFTVTEAAGNSTPGQFEWANANLPTYEAQINGVATDHSSNTVAVGYFNTSVDFGSGLITGFGYYDAFVVKYNAQGAVVWAKDLGGSAFDEAYAVAVDSQNNIIVVGTFQGTANFGGQTLTANGGASDEDAFVAKYSPSGTLIWATHFGSAANDVATSVAVDSANNIVVTSESGGTVNFGNGITATGHGGWDITLVKISGATGLAQWGQMYGGLNNDFAYGVAFDRNGDVLVTGTLGASGNLGGTPIAGSASSGIFVAKYSGLDGSYKWSRIVGGTAGNGITTDPSTGNVFVTGGFSGSVNFGGGAITTSWNGGIFIAGYDPSGNYLWASAFGQSGDTGYSIATDGSGHIAITDQDTGLIAFPGFTAYVSGFYLLDFTLAGNSAPTYAWGKTQTAMQSTYGVAFDSFGHVVAGGEFQQTANFGSISFTSGSGVYNGFVVEFDK